MHTLRCVVFLLCCISLARAGEVPVLTLTLPAQLAEGATPANNATLSVDRASSAALLVSLSPSPVNELTIPGTVTIPAGQLQATFTVRAVNDTKIDGNVLVTVIASASGIPPASAETTTLDNETRVLSITLPATVQEAGSASGSVSIPGSLPSALVVALTSSNETALTVAASVTISAGSTFVTFAVTASDNSLPDGSRAVNIVAAADTFTTATRAITVRDNEVAGYCFATLGNLLNISSPVSITVSAADVEGNAIPGFSGAVKLSVVLPDESTQQVTPSDVTLAGPTGWAGTVTLPPLSVAPLALQAIDAEGNSGQSTRFDILRVMTLTAADLIWDPARSLIYASVPATAPANANRVVAFDPATAQITGGVTTGQNPGPLAEKSDLIGGFGVDIRTDGNRVFSTNGVQVDGVQMRKLGTFPTTGLVKPELAANRVYFLERVSSSSSSYNRLGAFDPTTFTNIRRLNLPTTVSSPASFIRWGASGFAYRTASTAVLITSSQLVPSEPPADLRLTIEALPNPAAVGVPLTYSVRVTNQGPNTARNVFLATTLSEGQTIQGITWTAGTPTLSNALVTASAGELAANASATLTITVSPASAGSLTCSASVSSSAVDANISDNTAFKSVGVGFRATPDTINTLRFVANNLFFDPSRNVLWASIPSTGATHLRARSFRLTPRAASFPNRCRLTASRTPARWRFPAMDATSTSG